MRILGILDSPGVVFKSESTNIFLGLGRGGVVLTFIKSIMKIRDRINNTYLVRSHFDNFCNSTRLYILRKYINFTSWALLAAPTI